MSIRKCRDMIEKRVNIKGNTMMKGYLMENRVYLKATSK